MSSHTGAVDRDGDGLSREEIDELTVRSCAATEETVVDGDEIAEVVLARVGLSSFTCVGTP
jgi:hypothetical protein